MKNKIMAAFFKAAMAISFLTQGCELNVPPYGSIKSVDGAALFEKMKIDGDKVYYLRYYRLKNDQAIACDCELFHILEEKINGSSDD